MAAFPRTLSAARARKNLVSLGTFPDGLFLIGDDEFAPAELPVAMAPSGNVSPDPAAGGYNSEGDADVQNR